MSYQNMSLETHIEILSTVFLGNLSGQMTSGQHNDALLASISTRFCSSQTGFPGINARQYIPVPPPAMLAQYFKAKGTISLFDSSRVMEP